MRTIFPDFSSLSTYYTLANSLHNQKLTFSTIVSDYSHIDAEVLPCITLPVALSDGEFIDIVESVGGYLPYNCIQDKLNYNKFSDTNVELVYSSNYTNYNRISFFASTGDHNIYCITETPTERIHNGLTYRILRFNNGDIITVPNTDEVYNYLDKGAILVLNNSYFKATWFILDSMTVDSWLFSAIVALSPKHIKTVIGTRYITADSLKLPLLKIERIFAREAAAGAAGNQERYQIAKNRILDAFQKSSQSIVVNKLVNNEIPTIKINDINFSANRAQYEMISLEAEGLTKLLFSQGAVNTNQQLDIYTLIEKYATYIHDQIKGLPLNDTETGFAEDSKFTFSINNFPIVVETKITNTRRWINGRPINSDELVKVIRRAACCDSAVEFAKLVTSISRQSLYIHDIVANGLPIKVTCNDYNTFSRTPNRRLDPSLYFKKKGNHYYLIIKDTSEFTPTIPAVTPEITDTPTEPVERLIKLNKFVSFCRKIDSYNKQLGRNYRIGYSWHTRNGAWLNSKIKELILAHAVNDVNEADLVVVTDELLTRFMAAADIIRAAAEAQSQKLLLEVATSIGAEHIEWAPGKSHAVSGYKVKGAKREYFVNEENCQVFDMATKGYICIVNKGDMGVGKDALVARLLALKNDSVMAKQIHTLA